MWDTANDFAMFTRMAGARESKGPATAKSAALVRPRLVEGGVRNGLGASGRIQAKLTIGAVNDPLEAEADRVAAEVLERPDADVSERSPSHARGVQTSEGLPFGGRPLDEETRAFFEPRFGYDFSRVRIYPDERAGDSARSMGALAYTTGANIAFDSGRYQPNTGEGRRLLAHELTHVVQQGQANAVSGGEGMKISAGRAACVDPARHAGRPDGCEPGSWTACNHEAIRRPGVKAGSQGSADDISLRRAAGAGRADASCNRHGALGSALSVSGRPCSVRECRGVSLEDSSGLSA